MYHSPPVPHAQNSRSAARQDNTLTSGPLKHWDVAAYSSSIAKTQWLLLLCQEAKILIASFVQGPNISSSSHVMRTSLCTFTQHFQGSLLHSLRPFSAQLCTKETVCSLVALPEACEYYKKPHRKNHNCILFAGFHIFSQIKGKSHHPTYSLKKKRQLL